MADYTKVCFPNGSSPKCVLVFFSGDKMVGNTLERNLGDAKISLSSQIPRWKQGQGFVSTSVLSLFLSLSSSVSHLPFLLRIAGLIAPLCTSLVAVKKREAFIY